MNLLHRLKNRSNPDNLTRLHLAAAAARWGWSIGDHSYGRPKVRFPEAGRRLVIGRFCSIADKVEILLGGNHRTDWATTFPFGAFAARWPGGDRLGFHTSRGDVTIGSDVWLGSGATILSGIAIGHGAVVAARAVVTRDVPPYAIVAGNPARTVRLRFDAASVAALLETSWWDLPDAEVARLLPLLQSERIAELVAAINLARAGAASGRASGA